MAEQKEKTPKEEYRETVEAGKKMRSEALEKMRTRSTEEIYMGAIKILALQLAGSTGKEEAVAIIISLSALSKRLVSEDNSLTNNPKNPVRTFGALR